MYFDIKNYLKKNHNHTIKQTLRRLKKNYIIEGFYKFSMKTLQLQIH